MRIRTPVLPTAPVANNDVGTTNSDSPITLNCIDNDIGTSISIQSIDTSGTQGTATQSGGDIVYDPNGQFNGLPFNGTDTDSFSYTIVDSFGRTSTANVTVTVNRVMPPAPVANNDTATVDWDSTVSIPVLNNDTGTSISINSIDDSSTQGTVTTSGNDIVYDPNGQFSGAPYGGTDFDSFSYTIVDSANQTDTAIVNVSVNRQPGQAPEANDDSFTVDNLSTKTIQPIGNDVGISLSVVSYDDSGTLGAVTPTGNDFIYDTDGQFDTLPASGSYTDSFTYTIEDTYGQQDSATVTINVEAPPAFDNVSVISVEAVDGSPYALVTDNTNSQLFMVGTESGGRVYQFDFSTPGELDSATYSGNSFTPALLPRGIVFNDDGTRMYLSHFQSSPDKGLVRQYDLSTAFDITTATYSGVELDTTSEATSLQGLAINPTGTRLIVVGSTPDLLLQYNLSAGFDLSTATYSGNSFNTLSQANNPNDLTVNPAGTRLFTCDQTSGDVHQYNLTTAWDLSTISYTGKRQDIDNLLYAPVGLSYDTTGKRLYVGGSGEYYAGGSFGDARLKQYDLYTAYELY